jgi:phosphate/sulfate permease
LPTVENKEEDVAGEGPAPKDKPKQGDVMAQAIVEPASTELFACWFKKLKDNTANQDLHTQLMHESSKAQAVWDNEEQLDKGAKNLFNCVQVFTTSLNSFAHGANNITNSTAPNIPN